MPRLHPDDPIPTGRGSAQALGRLTAPGFAPTVRWWYIFWRRFQRREELTMSFSDDPTQGQEPGSLPGEDPLAGGASGADPSQGVEPGSTAAEDPTQGGEVGEESYEDPSEGGEVGSGPGEDPTD
jgi:hypothetical protein